MRSAIKFWPSWSPTGFGSEQETIVVIYVPYRINWDEWQTTVALQVITPSVGPRHGMPLRNPASVSRSGATSSFLIMLKRCAVLDSMFFHHELRPQVQWSGLVRSGANLVLSQRTTGAQQPSCIMWSGYASSSGSSVRSFVMTEVSQLLSVPVALQTASTTVQHTTRHDTTHLWFTKMVSCTLSLLVLLQLFKLTFILTCAI